MKYAPALLIVIFVIVTVVAEWTPGHNGQSACKDPSEYQQKFQHNHDPTKYWFCEQVGVPATLKRCEDNNAYMHVLRNCIPWGYWEWNAPIDPPTLA